MNKEQKKAIKDNELMAIVSKQDFIEYYMEHSQIELAEHFGITPKNVITLVHLYDFHKPKSAHAQQIKKAKLEKHGNENYNNIEKIKHTTAEKYGCENVFQSVDIKNKIKETNLDKYGAEHHMKNKEIAQKAANNHDYKELIEKSRETYFQRTGFYNPFENPEAMKKSIENRVSSGQYINFENTKATCQERYGVNFPCQTQQAMNSLKSISSNSKSNLQFEQLLIANNINYEREFHLDNYSYDFKVNNILIEINPTATHNSTFSPFKEDGLNEFYHQKKSQKAFDNGYRCIHVFDWDDSNKIIQLIKDRETVFARKCEIKEVEQSEAKDFINKNHIQGFSKSEVNIGLYYDANLVSIMTFGKPRYNKNYNYELIRYCSSMNVLGGAEKLLKYFITNYQPKSIISYCDNSKFSGITYNKLGFNLIKENVQPSLHWYNIKTKQHITDNLLRQRGFDQLFGTAYGKGTSNEQLMLDSGFVKIYDAGQKTYILNCQ